MNALHFGLHDDDAPCPHPTMLSAVGRVLEAPERHGRLVFGAEGGSRRLVIAKLQERWVQSVMRFVQ